MEMTNLLEETIKDLHDNNKTFDDVIWIGNDEVYIDKEIFMKRANKKYDSGYGGNEVDLALKIVGKDFWLERHEYDGSEWWEYKAMPIQPTIKDNDLEIIEEE